jgi:hypothetical protein
MHYGPSVTRLVSVIGCMYQHLTVRFLDFTDPMVPGVPASRDEASSSRLSQLKGDLAPDFFRAAPIVFLLGEGFSVFQ